MYTKHGKPTIIDLDIPIGATGAVGTVAGAGIKSVVRNAAGIYQINFLDNYNKYLGMSWDFLSPNSGSDVAITALTPNTTYVITTLGSATLAQWQTAGVPVGITPAVGVAFKCAATSAGTNSKCQVQNATGSGISSVEVIGNPSLTLTSTGLGSTNPYVIVQCLAATAAGTTTFVATDPANGCTMGLEFYFTDSSNVIPDVG